MSENGRDEGPWAESSADAQASTTATEDAGSAQRTAMARRDVLKALGITVGVLGVHALLPRTWTGPLVELTRLPAHAQTSGACAGTSLTAVRESNGQVTLSWTAPAGQTKVYRKARSAAERKLIGIVDGGIQRLLDVTAEGQVAYEYTLEDACTGKVTVEKMP